MLFRDIVAFVSLVAAASANLHHQLHPLANLLKRADAATTAAPSKTFDPAKVSSYLNGWLSKNPVSQQFTVPSETLAISIPSTLRAAIMTAVPPSVIIQLMDTSARCSVASEFKAGNTPSWYNAMPTEVKDFFQSMAGQIHTGSAVFTVTPSATAKATGNSEAGPVAGTSSSAALAPRATALDRGVLAGALGVVGTLGIALAL